MDAGVRAGVTIEPPRAKESLGAAAICPAPVGVFIFAGRQYCPLTPLR